MSIDRNATSNEPDDAALEGLLSGRLSEQLDGQMGRAAERFEAELKRGAVRRDAPLQRNRALWSGAASISGVGASIAIVVATVRFEPRTPRSPHGNATVARGTSTTSPAGPMLVASTAPTNEPIE